MNCNTLVSVIVPVYNAEKYISSCIENVLAQTYNNIELILINDGSQDYSGSICDKYASQDSRVKVIHQKNSGPSRARNEGIKKSNGSLLQFVDSDDQMDSFMIEQLTSVCSNKIDLIICGYKSFNKDIVPSFEGCYPLPSFKELFPSLFRDNLINPLWNKLYHASIIKNNNIEFPINMHNGEDLFFNIKYLKCCKNVYIKKAALYYYMHDDPDSLTKIYKYGFFENRKTIYKELDKFIKFLSEEMSFKNYKLLNEVYTKYLLQVLSNIFHSSNGLTLLSQRQEVIEVITDSWVINNLDSFQQQTCQQRIIRFSLKFQFATGIIMYFRTKRLIKRILKI